MVIEMTRVQLRIDSYSSQGGWGRKSFPTFEIRAVPGKWIRVYRNKDKMNALLKSLREPHGQTEQILFGVVKLDGYATVFEANVGWIAWEHIKEMLGVKPERVARGICSLCDKSVRLRKDGTIGFHYDWSKEDGRFDGSCNGVGQEPKKAD
jgi:hypothetical protein